MKKALLTISLLFLTYVLLAQTTIKLQKSGGVYLIPCKVNGKALSFIFDTGASDVLLSFTEAKKLYEDGLLKTTDFLLETENYQTASGDIVENKIVYIRTIEINGLVLNNVKASIASSINAPLLLGQSALSKFGEFTFNYQTNTLSINSNSNVDSKKKAQETKKKMIESGLKVTKEFEYYIERSARQEKQKQIINRLIDLEVIKIDAKNERDGLELTFSYDITNGADFDYSFIEHGFDNVSVDVTTEDGKTYSAVVRMPVNLISKRTTEGTPIKVNIRNKKAKYFRIYPVSESIM